MPQEGKNRDPRESELVAQRPNHPDFWRLSEAVIKQDNQATAQGAEAYSATLADLESVYYMADQRMLRIEELVFGGKKINPQTRQVMQALFLDAFYLGVGFERLGGHQEEQ